MVGSSTIPSSAKTHYVVSNAPTEASTLVGFLLFYYLGLSNSILPEVNRYAVRLGLLIIFYSISMLTLEEGVSCT